MTLKDLIEYCKLKDKCADCEYINACDKYFDGYIEHNYDPLELYDFINLDVEIKKDEEKMIDVDYYYHAPRTTLTMSYSEIESLVAYLKNFENYELPETISDEILPRMEDFLVDNL